MTENEEKALEHYKAFFSYFINLPVPPTDVCPVAATLAAAAMTADRLDEAIHELGSIANTVAGV